MKDQDCKYCQENEDRRELMLPVCSLEEYDLYLYRNQCYKGRCILAYKDHVRCLDELEEKDCAEYFSMVHKVTKALKKLYRPNQINIGTFGDTAGHIHCHIVPKYEGGQDFGSMFQMMPENKVTLTDAEYAQMVAEIRQALLG